MWNKLFGSFAFKNVAERDKFKELFNLYMESIPDSFYKNHFELTKEYPGTYFEDWQRLITHPAFDSWKSKQIAIIASTTSDKALASGVQDNATLASLKMRQEVLNSEKKVEKATIIVLPESLFFRED